MVGKLPHHQADIDCNKSEKYNDINVLNVTSIFVMSTHNPKFHTIDPDGTIILHSKHLGEVVEVNIDKDKRQFYGIKKYGERIEDGIRKKGERINDDSDCGNDFAQPVMLYKVWYCFENDTWVAAYQLKETKEDKQMDGFRTAREAWLYREVLISSGIAEK